jgi:hypothetical protein
MDKFKEKERCGIEADQKKPKLPMSSAAFFASIEKSN